MFVLLVMGGVLVLSISTVGVYIGLIHQQVKQRPVYLVKEESLAVQPRAAQ